MIHDEKKIEEKIKDILGLETSPDGQENFWLIRDEDGDIIEGADFSDELDDLKDYVQQYAEHIVQQESTRKTIKDIAPNGVTGGMVAITKKSVNGKNTFPVVSVDFEHDLVALDIFEDENNPTWYRAEDIIKAINQE